jgi:hypothetical protein
MRMNPEIRAKWTEALRSDKYKQVTGFLNADGGMCCLGVLCDILHPEQWKQDLDVDAGLYLFDGEMQLPPDWICIEAGLPVPIRDGEGSNPVNDLAEANDGGMTFEQIADIIEARL